MEQLMPLKQKYREVSGGQFASAPGQASRGDSQARLRADLECPARAEGQVM